MFMGCSCTYEDYKLSLLVLSAGKTSVLDFTTFAFRINFKLPAYGFLQRTVIRAMMTVLF